MQVVGLANPQVKRVNIDQRFPDKGILSHWWEILFDSMIDVFENRHDINQEKCLYGNKTYYLSFNFWDKENENGSVKQDYIHIQKYISVSRREKRMTSAF